MKKILVPVCAAAIFLMFAGFVFAQSYTPLAPLPGTVDANTGQTNISMYLSGAIKLLIALGAALAILFAIIGGTQYVAAGISPDAKSGAKERIWGALIGLVIILTSYLLLNSINPKLVQFSFMLPPVGEVAPGAAVSGVPGTCPIAPLEALTGVALSMENGATVLFTSDDSSVQRNLTELKKEVAKLNTALGGKVTVNSAYRPMAYQRHLYAIVNKWITQGLKDNTDPLCASLKSTVGAEYAKHGLGTVVASPGSCAPHVKGTGVDLQIPGYDLNTINSFMVTNHINLRWQGLTNDPVHFNLQNPPYSGCAASF